MDMTTPSDNVERTAEQRIELALAVAIAYGGFDGAHHKAWVIDQMVRRLAGARYDEIVTKACAGADGPTTYMWDCGCAP